MCKSRAAPPVQGSVYEEVPPQSSHVEKQSGVKLEDNVAYGHTQAGVQLQDNVAYGHTHTGVQLQDNVAYGHTKLMSILKTMLLMFAYTAAESHVCLQYMYH